MKSSVLQLTDKHVKAFGEFLLDGTANTLNALEVVFDLGIDCSDSSIETGPALENKNLKHLGGGPLYVISSALVGEVNGSIVLFLQAGDFKYLSEMMRPVLSLLSLTGDELKQADSENQAGVKSDTAGLADSASYREQMLDALAEMGNILIGLYTKSIYKTCGLNTHHSVPLVMRDPHQTTIRRILYSSGERERQHIVVENELFLQGNPIKLWCLISPSPNSFRDILSSIDAQNNAEIDAQQPRANHA